MGKVTGVRATGVALIVAAALALTGCGDAGASETGAPSPAASPTPTTGAGGGTSAAPVSLGLTPANGSSGQPISTEIGLAVSDGKVTAVSLTAKGGAKVGGSLRDDGSSWVPSAPLAYGKSYTATVTATGAGGRVVTRTTAFRTMARPARTIGSGLYLFDGQTYGVAMPVVVEFTPGIPVKDRATVQRRMFVRTDPPQPGAWHWLDNGTQAYYRAPRYWQPRTTLTVRIGLAGVPLSNGRYGNVDRSATARIGDRFEMKVDNATKTMSVYAGGNLVRTMPVSLGKKSTPSSSGTMVVMEKKTSTTFDTRDDPDPANRYVTEIDFAQRLTWGGEYIHAAPWSVDSQGWRNVSHGCVNVSTANARWLFDQSLVGDPVTVTGTERALDPGNGWTAWNQSWADFIKGSALPVPPGLASAG